MKTPRTLFTLLALLYAALLIPFSQAQYNPFTDDKTESKRTTVTLTPEVTAIAPGKEFTVAITLKHAEGWHSYYSNPGGPGLPLNFKWELPEGYKAAKLHWATPHLYESDATQFYVYEGSYTFLLDITAPSTAKVGDKVTLLITPTWQLCNESGCDAPSSEEFALQLQVAETASINEDKKELFSNARSHMPKSGNGISVSSEVADGNLVLKVSADHITSSELHYIDNARLTDPAQTQSITENAGVYTITAPLAEGATTGSNITGLLLVDGKTAYTIDSQLANGATATATNSDQSSASSGHGSINHTAPSAEDIAAAAKLYDAETPIDYVLLDGSKEKSHTLITALGFIFLGGFLLNLMPCVFPVLGIKVMGFVQQAGSDARKIKFHGLAFMAGLVVSMWVLAAIIYILIFTFGHDINWGQQLTNPIFLAFMILLLFLFGLNLAGVFEVGTSLTGAGGDLQAKKGYSGSFFSGVLTTLIATPCSGPFLGSVLGYTLKQPPLQGMIIFTVFALGISVPYVLLSFFPALINKLPRPGGWMVTFKQIMAFALFATAAYFFQSFAKITGTSGASWLVMAIVILSLAVWAYGKFATPYTPKLKKYIWGIGFPLLVAIGGVYITKAATEQRAPATPITASSWYPGVVEQNRAKKRVVWVDYTADW